jgi:hypothetical protein
MKFTTPEILIKTSGFILWACCLTAFPAIWATVTLGLGAVQLVRCEKINSTVNRLFKRRTTTSSIPGYIEDEQPRS